MTWTMASNTPKQTTMDCPRGDLRVLLDLVCAESATTKIALVSVIIAVVLIETNKVDEFLRVPTNHHGDLHYYWWVPRLVGGLVGLGRKGGR